MPEYSAVALVCAAGGLLAWVWLDWDRNASLLRLNHHRNRTELIQLHHQVAVGMSAADAAQVLDRFRSSHLELYHAKPGESEWHISTPSELGATNWTLGVQFSDGRISANASANRRWGASPPDRSTARSRGVAIN